MWHMIFSIGVVMGLGFGLMYCPAIVIVTMYFESRRSLATGIAVAGAGVGTVLFSPVNTYLIANYGWRSVFLAVLGILVLCAICAAPIRPSEFRAVEEIDLVEVKKTDNQEARAPVCFFSLPFLFLLFQENASLLIPDDKRLRTKSASSHTSEHGSLRLAKSLTHVSPDSDHSGCCLSHFTQRYQVQILAVEREHSVKRKAATSTGRMSSTPPPSPTWPSSGMTPTNIG